MYKSFFKRLLDFTFALLGLLVLSPLFILVTIGLFFANEGKPFFFQLRPGKNERLFKIIKFKTMNDKKDEKDELLSDAVRLTKIGSMVRKTSLDEIPQLINVLLGDMSLIGPRPLLPEYLPLYDSIQRKRHKVKPGITGWAQVNGRNAISWEQKFEFDVWYVDNLSFVLDSKIVFSTVNKIIKSSDISSDIHATMPRLIKRIVKKNKIMKKNILVTGAGALLGQGILRLLQIADFSKKIFTADPDAKSTGHWLGDYAIIIPKATDSNFIEAIKKIVAEHNIDVILVGTDVELPIFAKFKEDFSKNYNCKVLVSSEEVVTIANDKFLTADFLKKNNFPYPFSVMANDIHKLNQIENKLGFPLFAKPSNGARSVGIKKIENHDELMEIYHPNSNLVVQQYLSENDGEYTSGCTVVNGECKAIVTLKRDLRDGNTYRTYRNSETTKYDNEIIPIAEKLDPDGPVNFQFRILNGKPIIFEINGRFSGTTPLRYFYGYNEVEALLKYYLFGEEIKKPELKNGVVLRTWADLFVEENELEELNNSKKIENLNPKFFNFSLKK